MSSRRGSHPGRLGTYVGLSLLVHLHIALVVIAVMSVNPDGCAPVDAELPIEVALVPQDTKVTPEQLDKAEKKQEKKDKDEAGQVVDLPPPIEEKRPDKARFRSEYDSTVAKETKAKPTPFKPGKLVPNRPIPVPRQRARRDPATERKVARKVMKLAMRTQPQLPKSQFDKEKDGKEPDRADAPKRPKPEPGDKSGPVTPGKRKRLTLKDLQLTPAELARAIGSRVNDALDRVEEGERTLLNSKRWRFASFFNRVKRQVAQNWHPDRAYKRRDPSGNVYGFRDRLTILRVQLTPAGKLKNLHVEKASGVAFLDDEAVAAFRAAEPFPNPPRGLVKDGEISFRFGFLFEISRRPSFKLFRFRN